MLRSRILRRLLPFRSQSLQRSPLESFPAGLGTARALSSAVLSQPLTESDGPNRAPWGLFFSRGSKFASGYSALTRKPLDSIMNVESVKYASPEELTTIWNEYHIGRGHISAVMGIQLYQAFEHRAKTCPLFVIPIKRGMGYITLLVQAQMPYLLFTGLGDYQARGADATPYLTVTHYQELAPTKGLVLVRGDVVLTSKLTDAEARTALEIAHSFYLRDSRFRMVQNFNNRADEFEFREVLRELGLLG
ncbi:ATP synthase mitochondrial F1 complex assembly factor 1 [Marchantia polymorpha subsp. ruderalis]